MWERLLWGHFLFFFVKVGQMSVLIIDTLDNYSLSNHLKIINNSSLSLKWCRSRVQNPQNTQYPIREEKEETKILTFETLKLPSDGQSINIGSNITQYQLYLAGINVTMGIRFSPPKENKSMPQKTVIYRARKNSFPAHIIQGDTKGQFILCLNIYKTIIKLCV